jgi:hypothetical protein
MTTIDVSHTEMSIYMSESDNMHSTVFKSDDVHIKLIGLCVGYCTYPDIKFISVPNDTDHLQVVCNSQNILENILGDTMCILAQIVFNDDSFEITFSDNSETNLVITSSSHGKSMASHFEKIYQTPDMSP